jgi:hypothetical protein
MCPWSAPCPRGTPRGRALNMKWAQAIALLLAAWVESSAATETIVPAVILGYPEIIQSHIAAIEKSGQRRMKFNLIAVLRVVPLIQHVRSLVGRWRLSVVGDRGFARVAVSLLWPCRDDRYRDWDWVLAATNADWSVVAEKTLIMIEHCDPVQ